MESNLIELVPAFLAGLVLGAFYFGTLWLTVSAMSRVRSPGLLFVTSFVGRLTVALTGFWLTMAGRWERAIACLIGFLLARLVVTILLRPSMAASVPENRS